MGMIERVFPVVHPLELERRQNPWLMRLDGVLLGMAERIYHTAPFDLALIGEEMSGRWAAQEIKARELIGGGVLLPRALQSRLKPSTESLSLSGGLQWFPYRD